VLAAVGVLNTEKRNLGTVAIEASHGCY
jgi:hypothetical protein